MLLSAALHGWMVSTTVMTARDSIGFARDTANYMHPIQSRVQYMKARAQHPGYPLLITPVALLLEPSSVGPQHEQLLFAAQLTSSLAGVLLVIPMYWLARQLGGRGAGAIAGLLITFLPVFLRDTSDGLSDGPFLLFLLSGLYFAVKGTATALAGRSGGVWFLAVGLAAGCAYLIRPEGVLLALTSATGLLLLLLTRRFTFRTAGVSALLVLVGLGTTAGPYIAVIGKLTNKNAMLEKDAAAALPPVGGPVFAETLPRESQGLARAVSAIVATAKELTKTAHYGVAVFAIIGVVAVLLRWKSYPSLWVLLLYLGGHLLLLLALAYRSGYVSERHTMPAVAVGLVFGAYALQQWSVWWTARGATGLLGWPNWPAVIVLALVLSCVPTLVRPLHDSRVGHKHAAELLREELMKLSPTQRDSVVVLDHYEWAQYHLGMIPASRWATNHYAVPTDPPVEHQRIRYIVLEAKGDVPEQPEFNSPRHREAIRLLSNADYNWQLLGDFPARSGSKSELRVLVYRSMQMD